jgi:hypothetical protein
LLALIAAGQGQAAAQRQLQIGGGVAGEAVAAGQGEGVVPGAGGAEGDIRHEVAAGDRLSTGRGQIAGRSSPCQRTIPGRSAAPLIAQLSDADAAKALPLAELAQAGDRDLLPGAHRIEQNRQMGLGFNTRQSWCGGAAPAAIDANGASFSTNLGSERSAMLRNSSPAPCLPHGTALVILISLILWIVLP